MQHTENVLFEDFQISYDTTISTIQQIFKDEIKRCREDVDHNIAAHLETFRDEFLSIFRHVYTDVENRLKK